MRVKTERAICGVKDYLTEKFLILRRTLIVIFSLCLYEGFLGSVCFLWNYLLFETTVFAYIMEFRKAFT